MSDIIYDGPPSVPHKPPTTRSGKRKRRKVLNSDLAWKKSYNPRNIEDLEGPDHLVASELPEGFPEDLAFRALAAYALLRTLSRELRLSPFTPNVFLRALNLPYPSRLMGQVHVALLRHLLPPFGYTYRTRGSSLSKKRKIDGLRWDLRGGDNLTYLDSYTWPIFYDDYVHLSADIIHERLNDTASHLDYRALALQGDNEFYVPSFLENADEEDIAEAEAPSKVTRGRGFGLPTKKGRPTSMGASTKGSTRNLVTRPLPPQQKKRPFEQNEASDSETSFQSDESDTEDEEFDTRQRRGKGGGKWGRPRRNSPAQSNSTQKQAPQGQSLASSRPKRGVHSALSSRLKLDPTLSSSNLSRKPNLKPLPSVVPICETSRVTHPSSLVIQGSLAFDVSTSVLPSLHPVSVQSSDEAIPGAVGEHAPSSESEGLVKASNGHNSGFLTSSPQMIDTPQGSVSQQAMSNNGVPRFHSLPRPGNVSAPSATSMVGSNNSVESAACAGRARMQTPNPWLGSPLMMHLPRPGMPATLPQIPPRPKFKTPPVPQIRLQTLQSKGLCVSDEIANSIEKFLSGGGSPSQQADNQSPADQQLSTTDRSHSQAPNVGFGSPPDELDSKIIQDEWPQFTPLEKMREGIPHHRLPVIQKIQILEFLIDELLNIDYIAGEFTRRHNLTSCHFHPFGRLPTTQELDELENGDECAVCGLEGDLLCCDGCPSSYHRRCIGMNQVTRLPEGRWLCPECQVKDPALFGSLKGGQKAAVDWFSVKELREISTSKQNEGSFNEVETDDSCPSLASRDGLPLSNVLSERVAKYEDDSLCIVHGFVFRKPMAQNEYHQDLVSATGVDSSSHKIVKPTELFHLLQHLGENFATCWPLVQIPMERTKIWGSGTPENETTSIAGFFLTTRSFDPSQYQNIYSLAPLPQSIHAGSTSTNLSSLMNDYEHICYHVETRTLSGSLGKDMSCDKSLKQALRLGTTLFSPYKMICGYLEKMEASFSKAGLLSEFWGLRNKNFQQDTWLQNVRKCRSITRLSKLLVFLIDSVHCLAFNDEWFHSPITRTGRATRDDIIRDEKRSYQSLPTDWTPAKEKAIRKWEQCTESQLLSLLATESNNLAEFANGARLRARFIGRKRKGVKVVSTVNRQTMTNNIDAMELSNCDDLIQQPIESANKGVSHEKRESIDVSPGEIADDILASSAGISQESGSMLAEPMVEHPDREENANTKSRRSRRHGRDSHEGLINGTKMDDVLNRARAKKLNNLEEILSPPGAKEINWPVCGRYFFDPVGYIAPSEMKHLGRNAGNVMAPYVVYSKAHEVGQSASCHIWRKRCLDCVSLESLVLQIRVLHSFLDEDAISSCETAVRRYGGNKSTLQKSIACSLRDLTSGELNYFVLHPGRNRGCWVPARKIDTTSYVVERERRRAMIREVWQRKVLDQEKHANQEVTAKVPIVEQQTVPVATPQASQADQAGAHNRNIAVPTPVVSDLRENNTTDSLNPTILGMSVEKDRELEKCRSDLEAALKQHERDMIGLMVECISAGLTHMPEKTRVDLRRKNLANLRDANSRSGELCGQTFSDERLQTLLHDTETLAKKRVQSRLTGNKSSENRIVTSTQQESPQQAHFSHLPANQRVTGEIFGSQQFGPAQVVPSQHLYYEPIVYTQASIPCHSHLVVQPHNLPRNLDPYMVANQMHHFSTPNQQHNTGNMYPLEMPGNQQSTFVNQLQPMATNNVHGNFGQQLSHPFLQQHQPLFQPTILQQQLQFHEGFNPGQFYQHPLHQHFTNDPNAEFDLEPRPLEEMDPRDPRQWR